MEAVCPTVLPSSIEDEILRSELYEWDLQVDFNDVSLGLQGMLLTSLRGNKRKKEVA